MLELELMAVIAGHSRLDTKSALKLCDLLSKLFLDNWQNAVIISSIIIGVLRRNIEDKMFIEYVQKLVKVCLAHIYDSFSKGGSLRLKENNQHGILYSNTEQLSNPEIEKELQEKHRRSLIINLIRDIIH